MTKNTPTPTTLPEQFKDLELVTPLEPLVLKRGAPGRKIILPELKSPDELSGRWHDDPEDLRAARKEQEQKSSTENGKD